MNDFETAIQYERDGLDIQRMKEEEFRERERERERNGDRSKKVYIGLLTSGKLVCWFVGWLVSRCGVCGCWVSRSRVSRGGVSWLVGRG